MKYDLHIHSKYSSDGVLEPERIIKIATKRGLNGIAITDHDTIKRRKGKLYHLKYSPLTQTPPQNPLSSYYPSLLSH